MLALSFVPSHFIFTLLLPQFSQPHSQGLPRLLLFLLVLLLYSSSSLVTHGTALKWQTTFGSSPCRTVWKRKMPQQKEETQAVTGRVRGRQRGNWRTGGRASWRDDARTCHCTIIGFRNISRIFNKKTENRWNASNTHNIIALPSALTSLHSSLLSLYPPLFSSPSLSLLLFSPLPASSS